MNITQHQLAWARALTGIILLARLAGIRLRNYQLASTLLFTNYLYSARADLLLVPAADAAEADRDVIASGLKTAGADAIVARAICRNGRVDFDIGLNMGGEVRCQACPHLFLSDAGEPYVIAGDTVWTLPPAAFHVTSTGVSRSAVPPWRDPEARGAGIVRGEDAIAAALGGVLP